MSFEEFSKKIRRVNAKRDITITNSYIVYDSWNHYRSVRPKSNKYSISYKRYSDFIYEVNKRTAEKMLTGNRIKLFDYAGSIHIETIEPLAPYIEEKGYLVVNRPIDWKKTMELWYNDKESYDNKIKVYVESETHYRFVYRLTSKFLKNLEYYMFLFNRTLKKELMERIIKENIYIPLKPNFKNG